MAESANSAMRVAPHDGVAPHELVVLAASAGGIGATKTILDALPVDFATPIAVLQHRSATAPSLLAKILGRGTARLVKDAEAGELIRRHTVYVAPTTAHLTVGPDRCFHFQDGRRVHFLRSAADPLIQSAAHSLGDRLIVVILTGGGRNGSNAVRDVKALGGTVIAQDPATAMHPGMPRAAIATGAVDYVLPLDEIAPMLVRLTGGAPDGHTASQEAV